MPKELLIQDGVSSPKKPKVRRFKNFSTIVETGEKYIEVKRYPIKK